MRRSRGGRPRQQGKRYPGGKLIRTPKRDLGTAETRLRRQAKMGRLPPANRGLWEMGRLGEALSGTKSLRPADAFGPDVPPLLEVDAGEAFDPIGRAWLAHLLDGYPSDAADIRDAARRCAAIYWRWLPSTNPISGLYRNIVSSLVNELPIGTSRALTEADADERDKLQEESLLTALTKINRLGASTRRAFNQLVLDPFFDAGPPWLDRLIVGQATASGGELQTLRAAVTAIIDALL